MGFIRIFLALAVVFAHTSKPFELLAIGGELAVQCFFIVSGFYMALILSEKYVGSCARRTFWINRALKIYPAYWLVLALTIGYTLVKYCVSTTHSGESLGLYISPFHFVLDSGVILGRVELTFIAFVQLSLFPLDSLLFLRSTGDFFAFTPQFSTDAHPLWLAMFVPPAWTLALELSFYALAPFLITWRLRSLALLLGVSLCIRAYIYYRLSWQHDPWTYRFFPSELAFFLLGFMSFKLAPTVNGWLPRRSEPIVGWSLLLLTVAQLLFFSFNSASIRSHFLLATVVVAVPYVATLSSQWRWDKAIGELSYPVYIVHFLLLIIIRDHWPSLPGKPVYGAVVAVLSLIAAFVIKTTLMDRVEKRRRNNSEKLSSTSQKKLLTVAQ
jgi:peptidoglycan/LPS O-acetylase OafA/YrhL